MSAVNNTTGKPESTSIQSSNPRQSNSGPTNNRNNQGAGSANGDSFLSDHLQSHDHRTGASQPAQQLKQNSNASRKNSGQASNNNSRSYQNLRNKKSDSQIERRHLNDQDSFPQKSKTLNQKLSKDKSNTSSSKSPSEGSSMRRRNKLLSTCSTSSNATTCVCCLNELRTFVYYSCMHMVCLNCATKMRVICQKTDCPICRRESSLVYCTKAQIEHENQDINDFIRRCKLVVRPFSNLRPIPSSAAVELTKEDLNKIRNSGMHFNDELIREEYEEILKSYCDDCDDYFNCFDDLEAHVRRIHKKFFCELCLNNLQLFPYERKCYNREDLASHKRKGDKNDSGFKGHPSCTYCDQRYYDRDDLYRHFRRDHYYCHFCDSDGKEDYYPDYKELREHFLKHHFLCELDDCSKNAAQTHEYAVFRNDLDLQAHKKQKHAKTKNEAKSYGKLNIEFTMSRGRDHEREGGAGSSYSGGYGRGKSGKQQRDQRLGHHSNSAGNFSTLNEDESQIDQNVLRQSRAQFLREEEERKRQANLASLKKQYEEYEQSQPQKQVEKIVETEKKPEVLQTPEEPVSNPLWRNLISQGNAPRINKEAEFPSLVSGASSSPFMVQSKKSPMSAWSSKTPHAAPELVAGATKQPLSKKQAKKEKLKLQQELEKKEKNKVICEEISANQSNRLTNLQAISAATTVPVSSNFQDLKKYLDRSPAKSTEISQLSQLALSDAVTPKDLSKPTNASFVNQLDKVEDFPPPGYNKKSIETSPSSARARTSSFDGTKVAPPGFESIAAQRKSPSPPNNYIKPDEYASRNQNLSKKLKNLFGIYNESEYEKFKQTSVEFQLNNISAREYLIKCQALLDFQPDYVQFYDLIQEMIVLLPDSAKQQELYKAYSDIVENSNRPQSKSSWPKSGSKESQLKNKLLNKLMECQFCRQFFLNSELNFHQSQHHKKDFNSYYLASSTKAESEKLTKDNQLKLQQTTEDFPTLSQSLKREGKNSTQSSEPIESTEDFPTLSTTVKNDKPKQKSLKESYVFAKKEDFPTKSTRYQTQYTGSKSEMASSKLSDFPSLGETLSQTKSVPKKTLDKASPEPIGYSAQLINEKPLKVEKKSQQSFSAEEDFPSLSSGFPNNSSDHRFSSMPSASIFSNPSSHLSVLNKKKHRLQK